jgi:hypothetical protein
MFDFAVTNFILRIEHVTNRNSKTETLDERPVGSWNWGGGSGARPVVERDEGTDGVHELGF